MMALKMVELDQLKESAAKQKLDTENKKIRWALKYELFQSLKQLSCETFYLMCM